MWILFVYAALIMFMLWVLGNPRPSPLAIYAKASTDPEWASALRPLVPDAVAFTAYTAENLPPAKYSQLLNNVDTMLEILADADDLNEDKAMFALWVGGQIHRWLVLAGGGDVVEAAVSVFHHPDVTDDRSFAAVTTKLAKGA